MTLTTTQMLRKTERACLKPVITKPLLSNRDKYTTRIVPLCYLQSGSARPTMAHTLPCDQRQTSVRIQWIAELRKPYSPQQLPNGCVSRRQFGMSSANRLLAPSRHVGGVGVFILCVNLWRYSHLMRSSILTLWGHGQSKSLFLQPRHSHVMRKPTAASCAPPPFPPRSSGRPPATVDRCRIIASCVTRLA